MKRLNKIPNVILYQMNKKDSVGILRNIKGFECDYHFNSISEISLIFFSSASLIGFNSSLIIKLQFPQA